MAGKDIVVLTLRRRSPPSRLASLPRVAVLPLLTDLLAGFKRYYF